MEAMRISNGDGATFHPVMELDMTTLLRTKGHGLHGDNSLGPFVSFVVPAKAAISKTLLFVSENPALELSEGRYRFELSGNSSRGSISRHRFERPISSKDIADYHSGAMVFLDGRAENI